MVWGRYVISRLYLLAAVFLVFSPMRLWASGPWYAGTEPEYGQFLIGSHRLDHAWFATDTADPPQIQPIRSIHTFGYHLQSPQRSGMLEYGLEGGIYLGYDSQRTYRVVLASGQSSVNIRSHFWNGDVSAGVFASINPLPGLRFYTGVGPSLYWGQLRRPEAHTSSNSDTGTGVATIVIDNRRNRYDVGLGLYARAGVEVLFANGTSLGFAVRQLDATLGFGVSGRVRLREPQYLLTVGYYRPNGRF